MERKRKLFLAKSAVILGVIPILLWAHEYGPDVGYCGVPKENGTCAVSGCHVGTANNPANKGSVAVNFPGTTYVPGVKQHLTVTVSDPAASQKAWGFQLTARESNSANQAGAFASTDAFTLVMCADSFVNPNTELELDFGGSQTCPANKPLTYIEHSLGGYHDSLGKAGSYTYGFDWTPPATAVGTITFYVAGNAANGDLTTSGDHIYTATFTLTPSAGGTPPTVPSNGVVSNASGLPGISPNSYVSIYGSNLSSATDPWDQHITNGTLPTQIDGVNVSIGGKAAFVQYVSSGLVQVLTPPDLGLGTVAVQVTNGVGSSSPVNVTSQQSTPAFFLWPNSQPVATHVDYTWAVKNGTFSGTTTIPAKPGEYLIFWGTGFGPTTPAIPVGTVVPNDGKTTYNVTTSPTLTLNGQPMQFYAAALAPNYAGLYQVVAQVPSSMPDGDWPVVANIGSSQSPTGVLLTVKH